MAIRQLKIGLESLGHRVSPIRYESGPEGTFVDRLRYNVRLLSKIRRVRCDSVLGFDVDGFGLSGAQAGNYFVALKGVAADEARFETSNQWIKLRLQASLEKRNVRKARKILVTSGYSRRIAERAYDLRSEQLAIVPEGIDLSDWRSMAQQEFPRPDQRPTILSVAHQYPRKDTATLLKAVSLLKLRFPHVQARIVGAGPRLPFLRRLATDLSLEQNVRFMGSIGDRLQLMRHYFEADLFCLPSLQEGFGIVFLEAMAAGLPIVAARAGATPEVVEEGQVGLLFEPGDAGELSRRLARLLGDEELRREFSRVAREKVEEYEGTRVAAEFIRELGI